MLHNQSIYQRVIFQPTRRPNLNLFLEGKHISISAWVGEFWWGLWNHSTLIIFHDSILRFIYEKKVRTSPDPLVACSQILDWIPYSWPLGNFECGEEGSFAEENFLHVTFLSHGFAETPCSLFLPKIFNSQQFADLWCVFVSKRKIFFHQNVVVWEG